MTLLAILATLFGTLMALSNIPQAYKIFHRKSAKDISPITYSILLVGGAVWLLYGIELNNMPLIVANSVGTISVLLVLVGWFLYGK